MKGVPHETEIEFYHIRNRRQSSHRSGRRMWQKLLPNCAVSVRWRSKSPPDGKENRLRLRNAATPIYGQQKTAVRNSRLQAVNWLRFSSGVSFFCRILLGLPDAPVISAETMAPSRTILSAFSSAKVIRRERRHSPQKFVFGKRTFRSCGRCLHTQKEYRDVQRASLYCILPYFAPSFSVRTVGDEIAGPCLDLHVDAANILAQHADAAELDTGNEAHDAHRGCPSGYRIAGEIPHNGPDNPHSAQKGKEKSRKGDDSQRPHR